MFEINYTLKNEGFLYKLCCAKAIKRIMQDYIYAELKLCIHNWDSEEMIKEAGKRFSVIDFMNLVLVKDIKMKISVTSGLDDEMNIALNICHALAAVK